MRILFLFAMSFLITNCDKADYITMTYQETHCSDVWISNSTNVNSTEEALIDYFKDTHRIKLEGVTMEVVSYGPFCEACHCPTGREIEVNVDEKFVSTMETEGFVRQ